MKLRRLLIHSLAAGCAAPFAAAQTVQLYELGSYITPFDATGDGSLVVGSDEVAGHYFEWTASGGMIGIGGASAGNGVGGQPQVSEDGARVGGTTFNGASGFYEMSLLDRATGVWTPLGGIGGTSGSSASSGWGISGDGNHVVGLGWINAGEAHGIHWTAGSGTVDLGSSAPNMSSRANAVDHDGDVVVGWQDSALERNGAIWINGVQSLITTPSGGLVGEAGAVSDDGQWVVGMGGVSTNDEAWRWSQATGLEQLGSLGLGGIFPVGFATGISGDGSVIVGMDRPIGPATSGEGWLWTAATGLVSMDDYFAGLGLVAPNGLRFSLPLGVSPDGSTFFGLGRSNTSFAEGWIVRIDDCPSPTNHCTSVANSTGLPATISWSGSTSVASNDLVLVATDLPAMTNGIFFYGPGEQQTPFGPGFLCVSAPQFRLPVVNSGATGTASYDLDITSPPRPSGQITVGSTWSFQFWHRDVAAGGAEFNTTDGLTVTFCP